MALSEGGSVAWRARRDRTADRAGAARSQCRIGGRRARSEIERRAGRTRGRRRHVRRGAGDHVRPRQRRASGHRTDGRGAPGAFGDCVGSNTSLRRPGVAGAGAATGGIVDGCGRRPDGRAGSRRRSRQAEFDVLLHAAELLFHLLIAELKLLDHAGELADRRLEPIDAHDEFGRLGRRTGRLTRNLSRRQRRLLAARKQLGEQAVARRLDALGTRVGFVRGGGRRRKTENEDGKADAGG